MTPQEKLSTLFADNPNYLKDIENLSTPEQVADFLAQKGVNVTSGELIRYASESVAELDDAALAGIAGGSWTDSGDNDRGVGTGVAAFGTTMAGIAISTLIK